MNKGTLSKKVLGAALAALLGLVVPTRAQGPPKPGAGKNTSCAGNNGVNVNVTSTLLDKDNSNLPFQLQSDTQGKYVTYTNSKTDSVVSEIQGNSCDWILDSSTSQSRTVRLTLAYPASTTSMPPPFVGPTNVAAYIISKCGKNPLNNGLSYGTMTYAGQTLECGFSAAFNYNGKSYAVRMNPNNWAGTTWVEVTCAGAISSQCNSWTVTPIPGVVNSVTGQTSALGELTDITGVETPLGLYYVDFSASITK